LSVRRLEARRQPPSAAKPRDGRGPRRPERQLRSRGSPPRLQEGSRCWRRGKQWHRRRDPESKMEAYSGYMIRGDPPWGYVLQWASVTSGAITVVETSDQQEAAFMG